MAPAFSRAVAFWLALQSGECKKQPFLVIERDGLVDPALAMAMAAGLEQWEQQPDSPRLQRLRPRASLAAASSDVATTGDVPRDAEPQPPATDDQDALRRQLQETAADRRALQASAEGLSEKMQHGTRLRRSMVSTETAIDANGREMQQLELQKERLKAQHDATDEKLHALMSQRIANGESRLKHSKDILAKSETEVDRWSRMKSEYKATLASTVRNRQSAKAALEAARQESLRAQKAEAEAKSRLAELTSEAAKDEEAVRFAASRLKAAVTSATERELAEKREEASIARTRGIFEMEEKRLDRALGVGRERLASRMEKLKQKRSQAETRLSDAKDKYTDWQSEQQSHVKHLAAESRDIAEQEALRDQRRGEAINQAQGKIAAQAITDSGFDDSDWAWSEGGARGPDGEDVERVTLDD